jgi:hypothetical protein
MEREDAENVENWEVELISPFHQFVHQKFEFVVFEFTYVEVLGLSEDI